MAAIKGVTVPFLRAWREWKALEQSELGKRARITSTTISRLENGASARLGTIAKLADALGITREQLLHSQPDKKDRAALAPAC